MKATFLQHACVGSVAVVIFLCENSDVRGQSRKSIKLNESAFVFAAQLIKQGRVIGDRKGAWSEHRPSTDDENEFIRVYGFSEYAKWHLGIDDRYPENTKRRYKFPYGDFKNVHRCGVLAAQNRAAQHGYEEVQTAAAQLRALIDATRQTHTMRCPGPIVAGSTPIYFDVHAVKNASINSGNSSL
jgi:hypothetical protein